MRLAVLLLSTVLCSAQETRDAASLLTEVANGVRSAKSWLVEGYSTVENGTEGDSVGNFKLVWRAPDLARYESGVAEFSQTLVVCDGAAIWTYFPKANHYTKLALDKEEYPTDGVGAASRARILRCSFFLGDWANVMTGLASAAFIGHDTVKVNGQSRGCEVVRAEYPANDASRLVHRSRVLCIDPDRRLILRERLETDYAVSGNSPGVHKIQTTTYSAIRRDPELEADLFTFRPPEGSTTTDLPKVYRIGEGITPPVLLQRQEPEYTKKAIRAGIQGAVLLGIEIGSDGKAHDIRVLRPLDPDLDKKAVECVAAWKFRPGAKDGEPVTVAATVEVNFRLVDGP